MSNSFPHDFPCIRDTEQKTVLFCGAGLSAGMVPVVGVLFQEIREDVEKKLGIPSIECSDFWKDENWEDQLYYWAECVLRYLKKQGVFNPKLELAKALGITTDLRWKGKDKIDFRGNTDRHRVIARFAKEGCWQSVWSFNWDCVLENAMESVGVLSDKPKFKTPWHIDHYYTHVTNNDLVASHCVTALAVRKPHGCVKALKEAEACESIDKQKSLELSERFMITKSELEKRDKNYIDDSFFSRLDYDISVHVSVTVGWRIAESSLREKFISALSRSTGAKVNIIDIEFSNDTHDIVCAAAGQDKSTSFFEVKKEVCPKTDDLFRWIHALYTLDRLTTYGGEPLDSNGGMWRDSISVCSKSEFFIDWADEFLPTWTRLCWSADLIHCYNFEPHQIDVDRRDEHIPLNIENIERPDLISAKRILAEISIADMVWDCKMFPGGLYDGSVQHLVIPLPAWKSFNELRALKPMINAIQQNIWMVQRVSIYPVVLDDKPYDPEILKELLFAMANVIRVPAFAEIGGIDIINKLDSGRKR